jgi:hypothetical protein
MTAVSFSMNPITLANMLTNAVEISKEAANIEAPDSLLLAYQPSPDGRVGTLVIYGCGRYAAGRTVASLDDLPSSEAISLSITRDHAAELSSALRKTSRAADTRVGVALHEQAVEGIHPETGSPTWGNLVVAYGDKQLGHLHDSDPHGKLDQVWSRVDDLAAATGDPVTGVLLHVGVLGRLTKMKGTSSEVADVRTTPMPGVVAVKMGAGFVALLGEVNKASFLAGGRFGDGPGRPEQLWASK